MALAEYFKRNAIAASHVIAGFDEEKFAETLSGCRVGISFASQAALSAEGRNLLDLLVRIVARLYPEISLRGEGQVDRVGANLRDLALSINPLIDVLDGGQAPLGVCVGEDAPAAWATNIFVGSAGWRGLISSSSPRPVGDSSNPFGAGIAAALGAANVFRVLFLTGENVLDVDAQVSAVECINPAFSEAQVVPADLGEAVLVGLGAVGNSAVWALSRLPCKAQLHIVDHELLEASNLQRYVLAAYGDIGSAKVDIAKDAFSNAMGVTAHQINWQAFVHTKGYKWERVLVAVDSARDRRAVQVSLPRWIANAWTQVGDIGVSVHRSFSGAGACVNCLYLPAGKVDSEDVIIGNALGIPDRLIQIRELLYRHGPVSVDLLELIGQRLSVPAERLLPYSNKPLRSLYIEGICGGAVLPVNGVGVQGDMLVPLAHQSVLSGLLLAAALAVERSTPEGADCSTTITRIDLLRRVGEYAPQRALKDPRNICICQDPDYVQAYHAKWGSDRIGSVARAECRR